MRAARSRLVVPVLLLGGLAGQAHAAEPQPAAGMAPMGGMNTMQAPAAGSADAQMMAGMQQMQKTMKAAPLTGDPDHDFVAMMLPHHQGAVSMAQVELRDGKDPSLRKLARAIVAAQDREIVLMKSWLAAHPAKTEVAN